MPKTIKRYTLQAFPEGIMRLIFFMGKLPLRLSLLTIVICLAFSNSIWAIELPSGEPYCDLTQSPPSKGCCIPSPIGAWYIRADGLWLMRDREGMLPVATMGDTTNVAFSTDDLSSPFRAGARVLIGHTFRESPWQIDGSYFFVDTWLSSASISDQTTNDLASNGNLSSPFTDFGQPDLQQNYDYNNYVHIRELSQMQNGELNLRYIMPMPHACLTSKFIIGLRYMSINEQFQYDSQSAEHTALSISTQTTNRLIGPQLGGEFNFFVRPNCWIGFEMKGAICDNQAVQNTTGNIVAGAVDITDTRDVTSFVGDLDLMLVWQITPHFITRIGYQAICVTNLAMGSRNYDPFYPILENQAAYIDTNSGTVYHGPHLGLELSW
ncbi:MAG: BBP7 family outer membrane beta-barrel protein [Thermoguttaceae bacterium]